MCVYIHMHVGFTEGCYARQMCVMVLMSDYHDFSVIIFSKEIVNT